MSMEFTEQQQKLFKEARSTKNHIVCESVPGGAKTFSTVQCLKERQQTVKDESSTLVLAFSNIIKNEFISKVQEAKLNVTVDTFHGLGNKTLKGIYGATLVGDKVERWLKQDQRFYWQNKKGYKFLNDNGWMINTLQEKLRLYNRDPTEENINFVAERYGLTFERVDKNLVCKTIADTLEWGLRSVEIIDYADMLWIPIKKDLRFPYYSFIAVDEYQDLSPLMQAFIQKLSKSGQVMVVGDPHQSIFGFAAADEHACKNTRKILKQSDLALKRRDLTVTFRCPINVVKLAQQIVPEILWHKNATEGEVKIIESSAITNHVKTVMGPGDLVIARRNAELLELSLKLMTAKIPFELRGKLEDSQPLISHIKKMAGRSQDVQQALYSSERYLYKMKELNDEDEITDSTLQLIKNRHEALKALSLGEFQTIQEIIDWLMNIYSRDDGKAHEKDRVILTTGHKAKGLECNNSLILRPDLFPMVFPCSKCKGGSEEFCIKCFGTGVGQQPWEIEQEKWLTYVAITRSKKSLTFVDCYSSLLRS